MAFPVLKDHQKLLPWDPTLAGSLIITRRVTSSIIVKTSSAPRYKETCTNKTKLNVYTIQLFQLLRLQMQMKCYWVIFWLIWKPLMEKLKVFIQCCVHMKVCLLLFCYFCQCQIVCFLCFEKNCTNVRQDFKENEFSSIFWWWMKTYLIGPWMMRKYFTNLDQAFSNILPRKFCIVSAQNFAKRLYIIIYIALVQFRSSTEASSAWVSVSGRAEIITNSSS